MRLLTFNWHETYIHLLSRLGHRLDIVLRDKPGGKRWIQAFRPLPANASLVEERVALKKLEENAYRMVICHNVRDLAQVYDAPTAKVIIFHTLPSVLWNANGERVDTDLIRNAVRELMARAGSVRAVYVSPRKRTEWGIPGEVILPGVDLDEYRGWSGQIPRILRVGQFLYELDSYYGQGKAQRILAGLPVTYLGMNPQINNARMSYDWDDLRLHYRLFRVLFHTPYTAHDDGYNLSLLEAMATGMPVVSMHHPGSPIIDGMNGILSDQEDTLSEGLTRLLSDTDYGKRLGEAARETVRAYFPIERFLAAWREIVETSHWREHVFDEEDQDVSEACSRREHAQP